MAEMGVYGRDGIVRQGWECMAGGMGVNGRDGSIWQGWDCKAGIGVYGRDGVCGMDDGEKGHEWGTGRMRLKGTISPNIVSYSGSERTAYGFNFFPL
jgi:hypothetical protein